MLRAGHLPQSAMLSFFTLNQYLLKNPELQVFHLPAEHPTPWGEEPYSLPLVVLAPKNLKKRVEELQQK